MPITDAEMSKAASNGAAIAIMKRRFCISGLALP